MCILCSMFLCSICKEFCWFRIFCFYSHRDFLINPFGVFLIIVARRDVVYGLIWKSFWDLILIIIGELLMYWCDKIKGPLSKSVKNQNVSLLSETVTSSFEQFLMVCLYTSARWNGLYHVSKWFVLTHCGK